MNHTYFLIRSNIKWSYHLDRNRIITLFLKDDYIPEIGANTLTFDDSIGVVCMCKV